jgi:hypothetical protein
MASTDNFKGRYVNGDNSQDGIVLFDDMELRKWSSESIRQKAIENGTEKIKIPLSKMMWLDGDLPKNVQLNNVYHKASQKDIDTVNSIIEKEFKNFEDMTDLEKVVAVDSFVQREIQYVGRSETCINGIRYSANDKKIDEFNKTIDPNTEKGNQPLVYHSQMLGPLTEGNPAKNRGVCDDLAYLPTVLLNNPTANIKCYNKNGSGHHMNLIVLDGEIYCMDLTQNVSAGKHRFQTEQNPYGVQQSSKYNYGATLQTADSIDMGGDLRLYRKHDITSPNGTVSKAGYSNPNYWWQAEKTRKKILDDAGRNGTKPSDIMDTKDPRTDYWVGINDDYIALTQKYPHATKPIDPAKIEAAIQSLKQKGFNHLFEYPQKPYYNQTAKDCTAEIAQQENNLIKDK